MAEDIPPLRLEKLHPKFGVIHVDIRELVDVVRKSGLAALPQNLDPKVRRNTLLTILTEKFWQHVERAETESPETAGVPLEEVQRVSNEASSPNARLAETIRSCRAMTMRHFFECSMYCDSDADPVVGELREHYYYERERTFRSYLDLFRDGIGNANMMSWESIHILPHVYRRQYGENAELSMEQYRTLATRNITFLRHLARAHMAIFTTTHANMSSPDFPAFAPDVALLTGNAHTLRMELHPDLQGAVETLRGNIRGSIATGCPAIHAKASNNKDVIIATHEWIQRVAERCFFPYASDILKREYATE